MRLRRAPSGILNQEVSRSPRTCGDRHSPSHACPSRRSHSSIALRLGRREDRPRTRSRLQVTDRRPDDPDTLGKLSAVACCVNTVLYLFCLFLFDVLIFFFFSFINSWSWLQCGPTDDFPRPQRPRKRPSHRFGLVCTSALPQSQLLSFGWCLLHSSSSSSSPSSLFPSVKR